VSGPAPAGPRVRPGVLAGVAVCATVFVAGLLWAKWMPYAAKTIDLNQTHHWPGSAILTVGGVRAGDPPSWHAAVTFVHAYASAIWPALVVAVLLSAAVQAFLPPQWLPAVLNRRGVLASAVAGGAGSMPSMMCACCTAPVAVMLRRNGVNRAAAVAYWLGNPLLNPAVLVFLALVAPWQWTVTRLVVGVATVVGVAALVGVATRGATDTAPDDANTAPHRDFRPSVPRFGRALLRMCVTLLPEYAVLVVAIGACRGWLLTLTEPAHPVLVAVLVAAVVGTLMVIPTAGEIPIVQALALLGVSSGVLGALLITLPAVSLPGAAMVARSFGLKAVGITAAAVTAAGMAGAVVLTVLS
jgi:uncharacterized protein